MSARQSQRKPTRKKPAAKRGTGREKKPAREKICFVMMPFTDPGGYPPDHFKRVYRYVIQPACERAGFRPIRVDDINTSNHIVIDIIRYIVEADMAICDLSSRSPNVLYELGVRHAFNKPVTLIKDLRTTRMFDIQGLRDIEYDEELRVDNIEEVVPVIAESLKNTYGSNGGKSSATSIIQLLGIEPATPPSPVRLSEESHIILGTLDEVRERLRRIETLVDGAPKGIDIAEEEAAEDDSTKSDRSTSPASSPFDVSPAE